MTAPLLITGSSGFIGTHLCAAVKASGDCVTGLDLNPPRSPLETFEQADIRELADLERAASQLGPSRSLIHLAALGEVMIPFAGLSDLYNTNVQGTWNVLSAFDPQLFVFASSSSVYGNAWVQAPAVWDEVNPVGCYGMSKAAGELLGRDWSSERDHRAAVSLRLANVIGPGCRGLLRYVADHALSHPDGDTPAQLRGAGKLIRDYVPVETVVGALIACCRKNWASGLRTMNISSGTGLTNGEVVEIARPELERAGLKLKVEWSDGAGQGEALSAVLDPSGMEESLEISRPGLTQIEDSIRNSVRAAIGKSIGAVTDAAKSEATCAS